MSSLTRQAPLILVRAVCRGDTESEAAARLCAIEPRFCRLGFRSSALPATTYYEREEWKPIAANKNAADGKVCPQSTRVSKIDTAQNLDCHCKLRQMEIGYS